MQKRLINALQYFHSPYVTRYVFLISKFIDLNTRQQEMKGYPMN